MALRTFFAFQSAGLTVAAGSPSLTPGSSIINNSDTPNGTIFEYSRGFGTEITLDDTGGGTNTFNDDQANNHIITDGAGIVANGTRVESESHILLRALDGNGNPTGPTITVYVFSQNGVTGNVWGFATNTAMVDGTRYVKTGGNNAGSSAYSNFIACFGPGTRLRGTTGQIAIEDIRVGDRIWTNDDPACAVTWIGRTTVAATGAFAPVVIAPGALGNSRTLRVSAEHRMLVDDAEVELLFGTDAALVAAKHLVGLPGITQDDGGEITYTHLMFDRHRVVDAEGALSESFFPADMALSVLDEEPLAELLSLFPALLRNPAAYGSTAAPVLRRFEGRAYRALRMRRPVSVGRVLHAA